MNRLVELVALLFGRPFARRLRRRRLGLPWEPRR